jgi:nucleotide-binding universal stress UspA family protein
MAIPQPSILRQPFRVLVPTDFSESSRGAIDFVMETFGNRMTHLYLLHAFREKAPDSAPMVSLIDILREKSERLMQNEIRHLEASRGLKDFELSAISRFDGFFKAISNVSEAENIDMIVMGSNGHTHPRMDQREDDPSYLVQKLNRPLLLVPKLLI